MLARAIAISVLLLAVSGTEVRTCEPDQIHTALGNSYYYAMNGVEYIEGEPDYDYSVVFHTKVRIRIDP